MVDYNSTNTGAVIDAAVDFYETITATAAEINILDGVPGTLTATELGYMDGVTSAVQTQIDSKISSSSTDTLTNKTINAANNTSQVAVEIHSTSDTLTTAECYGKVHYVSSAATLTLPAVADGMHLTVITIGAVAVSIDPNASDKIWLDGTALDDGDKITNTSVAGDIAVLTYYSADGWHASTNSWTDGGA